MSLFAYLRVSTLHQCIDRQLEILAEYCKRRNIEIDDEHIFKEKVSGKKGVDERTEYAVLRRVLRAGDELFIDSLDRLGRTKKGIIDEIKYLRDKKVILRVNNIPTTLIDETQFQGNEWILDMVTNVLFEVLSAVAEQELVEKERRTRAGIELAKAAGKYKGRKPIEYDHDTFNKLYPRWKSGGLRTKDFQSLLKLKPNTFYRIIERYEAENGLAESRGLA